MTNPNDVIVVDEEYQFAANELKQYGESLDDLMSRYTASARQIAEEAIKSQRVSERLLRVAEKVDALRTRVTALTEAASRSCRDYVQQIDEADQFLY